MPCSAALLGGREGAIVGGWMAVDGGMGEDVDVDVVESQAATHGDETRRYVRLVEDGWM